MTLDTMLDDAARGTAQIEEGWGQGRAVYGGLVASLLVSRAEALAGDPERRLRSASVSFVGPVAPGAATIDGAVLRAGKSATQVEARIVQEREVRAMVVASFGGDRPTVIDPAAIGQAATDYAKAPSIAAPETLDPVPYVPGMTPDFFQHIQMRFASGNMPFTGASNPDFGGWMRFADPPARLGDRELIALADAWPPAVLPLFSSPVSASSLAWSYEPVAAPAPGEIDQPGADWQYDVTTEAIGAGYANTAARIWDDRGRLRVLSRQTVTFFG